MGDSRTTLGSTLNAYNDVHPVFSDTVVTPHGADASAHPVECLLVIDCGFSQTTITPLYNGCPLQRAIRRLDFGGKHLTNLLKEVISVRYFDLHQDVKVVNDIKEDVCFVSQDFKADMEQTWKGNIRKRRCGVAPVLSSDQDDERGIMDADTSDSAPTSDPSLQVDYILPDGIRIKRGFFRPHDPQVTLSGERKLHAPAPETDEVSMTLGTERFSIPEILFSPSDIASPQPGLAQCVMQSLSVLPPALQACMLSNILLVGGTARLPGLVERLQSEVRSLAPVEFVVRVRKMEDPVTSTWLGGARLARNQEDVRRLGVTRQEYFEHGSLWVGRRFGGTGK